MEKTQRTLFTVAFTIGASAFMSLLTMVNAGIFCVGLKSYTLAVLNLLVSLVNWQVMFSQIKLYLRARKLNATSD